MIDALDKIGAAAKVRLEAPKFTLGWSTAVLAYAIFVMREYASESDLLRYLSAAAVLAFVVACSALIVRVGSLMRVQSLEADELFSGRIPDPNSPQVQRALREAGQTYRLAGRVGVPAILIACLLAGAMTIALVVHRVSS